MKTILQGVNLPHLRSLPDNSVDSIVTDPPYALRFMNSRWDYDLPSIEVWRECLRVLKPGGHLLSFGGSRTYHRLVVTIEDAGFEIRDMIAWIYGSGYPKNHDVSKAILKKNGHKRDVIGKRTDGRYSTPGTDIKGGKFVGGKGKIEIGIITAPGSDQSAQYDGWGTALKPAIEPIVVARKPLIGTIAENVVLHMTGGLNIQACRVSTGETWVRLQGKQAGLGGKFLKGKGEIPRSSKPGGRWPANVIHDGSDDVVGLFPAEGGAKGPVRRRNGDKFRSTYNKFKGDIDEAGSTYQGDTGSPARFYYCAKASNRDRDEGLQFMELVKFAQSNGGQKAIKDDRVASAGTIGLNKEKEYRNFHPTVKPTTLMAYLVRLVTPVGGTVLDPYAGSGSTGKAAILNRFNCILIEREEKFIPIINARCDYAEKAVKDLPLTGEELIQLIFKQENT